MDKGKVLQVQTALVTEANSGIGAEIAQAMGAAGANVAVNYVAGPEDANRVVEEIRAAGGSATAAKADVSQENQVEELFLTACREYGTVDILVSNAGIQQDAPFAEMTLAQWQKVLNGNLTGVFLCSPGGACGNFCVAEWSSSAPHRQGKLFSPVRCTKSSPGQAMPITPVRKVES